MQKVNQAINSNDISDKGHKIVAALYLVTGHLSDNEPLKVCIRTRALTLFDEQVDRTGAVASITNLLKSAMLAKIISQNNVTIILRELALFVQTNAEATSLTALFTPNPLYLSKTKSASYKPQLSETSTPHAQNNNEMKQENKNKRQDQILSFINGRKSAVIKDISTLFPDVSEKTIQRELGALVDTGRITKRGSKRWSIYMAI